MLAHLPQSPGPEDRDSLRCLELEWPGELMWARSLKGAYYGLTYGFLTSEPHLGKNVLGCSAWLGEAGGRQRPSPSLGEQPGEI